MPTTTPSLPDGEPGALNGERVGWRGRVNGELVLLATLIAVRTVVFTALKWMRYRSFFAFEYEDTAASHQIIWQFAHGNGFYQSITGEYFLGHFEPIFALPGALFALAPHPVTIFAFTAAMVSLGALPIYLLVRRRTGVKRAALACGIAYLLYAPLGYVNLGDVRAVLFCAAPLLFALYFFEVQRPWPFLVCAVLTLACKENTALVLILLGGVALIRRRRWPWVVGPVVLGVLWFGVATRVVLPRILSGHMYSPDTILRPWGGDGNPFDLAWTILSDPVNHFRLVTSHCRLVAALQLLGPLCFLSLLAPELLLLAAPGAAQIALLRMGYFPHIRAHWFTLPSVLAFAAAAYGLTRLLRTDNPAGRLLARVPGARRALPWLMATGCALSNVLPNVLTYPDVSKATFDARFLDVSNMFDGRFYAFDDEDRRLWRIIGRVPADATVAVTGHLLPAMAHRRTVIEMWRSMKNIRGEALRFTDCDFMLMDLRSYVNGGGWYEWPMSRVQLARLHKLLAGGGWRVLLEEGTTLLLKHEPGYVLGEARAAEVVDTLNSAWMDVQGYYAVHVERGSELYEEAKLQAARAEYLAAVEAKCPDPYAYSQLCGISLELRRWRDAVKFGQDAVRMEPWDSFSWYRIGQAYLELNQLPSAGVCLRRALSLFPYSARYRAHYARYFSAVGMTNEARRQAKIALKIDPTDDAAKRVGQALGVLRPSMLPDR